VTLVKTYGFEEGVDGALLTVNSDYLLVSGDARFSTLAAAHGSRGVRSTSGGFFAVAAPANDCTVSVYATVRGSITGSPRVVNFTDTAGVFHGMVRFHAASGLFDICNSTSTRVLASTATWVPEVRYRFDVQITGTGTSRTITVRVFEGEGTVALWDSGPVVVTTTTTNPVARIRSGGHGITAGVLDVDTVRVYDTLEWPTPIAPVVSGTVHHLWSVPLAGGIEVMPRVSDAMSVRVAASLTPDMADPVFSEPAVPDSLGYSRHAISLEAGRRWYYRTEITPLTGPAGFVGPVGRARSAPTTSSSFRFAFGGNIVTGSTEPAALDDLSSWGAEFLLHLGNMHSSSPSSTVAADHTALVDAQIETAAHLEQLLEQVPMLYARGDRDSVDEDNGDTNTPTGLAAVNAWRQYAPRPPLGSPSSGSNHFAFSYGRVRFIVLDTKSHDRSAGLDPQAPGKTMLGATQKAWLLAELARNEPVKVVVSEVPWIGPSSLTQGEDKWWAYEHERISVGAAIAAAGKVVMLTGDSPALTADDGRNNTWGGFRVWGAAGFDDVAAELVPGGPYWRSYNAGAGVDVAHYGRVTVADTGTAITLSYSGWDALAGVERISDSVTFPAEPSLGEYTNWDGAEFSTWQVKEWNGVAWVNV
jgi:alkaline phosphatase D